MHCLLEDDPASTLTTLNDDDNSAWTHDSPGATPETSTLPGPITARVIELTVRASVEDQVEKVELQGCMGAGELNLQ